jgi:type II secretory pathway pseudopilin PulG
MIRLLNREKGFTIIEGLVAQVVLILVAVATWSAFTAGIRFNAEAEDRTIAANIAQYKVEELMNTPYRYIVERHPAGETSFDSLPQAKPFWTINSEGGWILSLQEGKYVISYPDGEDADPLRIRVAVWWKSQLGHDSSLDLETRVSMTPGRFRQ